MRLLIALAFIIAPMMLIPITRVIILTAFGIHF